jgi:hypothetical protein
VFGVWGVGFGVVGDTRTGRTNLIAHVVDVEDDARLVVDLV